MATVIREEFYNFDYKDTISIFPLGDIHLGALACDEVALKHVINRIQHDPNAYWIGMGDYCEWINMHDPRFSVTNLASWITRDDLVDLSQAQFNMLVELLSPIFKKCLGLVCGNHETAIQTHTERDVYSELVTAVKRAQGRKVSLGLGFYGWLHLLFYATSKEDKGAMNDVIINVHHGFTGGRLAGGKALNMQRWLWTHDADLVIFGHSHNESKQSEAVECLDRGDNIVTKVRKGIYGGTFLRSVNSNGPNTYSEIKGYMPLPCGVIPEIILKPHDDVRSRRVVILG